jgi:hypothetical protein
MLPVRPLCLRPAPYPLVQFLRHGSTKRKAKRGKNEAVESVANRRLRAKRKLEKELDKRRKRYEKLLSAQKAKFSFPEYKLRPDVLPFGTGMGVLRGLAAREGIFVRSWGSRFLGERKVVATVRIVPNEKVVKPLKGRVKFPHPVVKGSGKEAKKKQRIAVIVEDPEQIEAAKRAEMTIGGKDYVEKVSPQSKFI